MTKTTLEKPLLQPFDLRGQNLRNRIVMAPMTRARAGAKRVPNALMSEYYRQRATAGLIISEATVISAQGIGWQDSPGIYTDAMTDGWARVVGAVHSEGGKMFLQLWHTGRASHSSFLDERLPVAPSPVKHGGEYIHTPLGKQSYETPRALETNELAGIVENYQQAAQRAMKAGFDGIEVHAANGYLIDQFLQSRTNQREDAYGGSIENRYRLLAEVMDAVIAVFPANKVAVRLSPNGNFNDMGSPDFRAQFSYVAQQLDRYDLAYLHVMDGLAFGSHGLGEPMTLREFRGLFSGPLIGNCGYDFASAEESVRNGDADLIAFGRPYISNPDLVARYEAAAPLNPEAPMSSWYTPAGAKGYTDFPKLGVF